MARFISMATRGHNRVWVQIHVSSLRVKYTINRNRKKIQKNSSGKTFLKYDVIYDALQRICNKNLKAYAILAILALSAI
jgi:hypothetical protein